MLALDVARIEAGLILADVDYVSSKKALIESQKYSPFEIGLGKLVHFDKENFIGREALLEESKRGPLSPAGRTRNRLGRNGGAVRQSRTRAANPEHRVARACPCLQGSQAGREGDFDNLVSAVEAAHRVGQRGPAARETRDAVAG